MSGVSCQIHLRCVAPTMPSPKLHLQRMLRAATVHRCRYNAARFHDCGERQRHVKLYRAQNVDRQAGDRMAAIFMQQVENLLELPTLPPALPSLGIAALGMNNQATQIEFRGRMSSAGITHTAAVDSAKLQSISMIVSRMGATRPGYRKGMEMRY